EEIGLLVRPLGRTEAGEGLAAVALADALEPTGGDAQRLLPARLAEMGERLGRVDGDIVLGDAVLADEGHRQPVRMIDIVETEAALDAEPILVRRTVAAVDGDDPVVLDLVGDLAAN